MTYEGRVGPQRGIAFFVVRQRAVEEAWMDYGTKRELRDAPLFSRVTRADQALIRAAAETEGLSLSSYVAAAAVERATTDLGRSKEDQSAN